MPVRDTSRTAMEEIQRSGAAISQWQKVYDFVLEHRKVSRSQIEQGTGVHINAVSGRVNELIRDHRLVETRIRFPCPITHRSVHLVFVPGTDPFCGE